jgi:hypothetical protein
MSANSLRQWLRNVAYSCPCVVSTNCLMSWLSLLTLLKSAKLCGSSSAHHVRTLSKFMSEVSTPYPESRWPRQSILCHAAAIFSRRENLFRTMSFFLKQPCLDGISETNNPWNNKLLNGHFTLKNGIEEFCNPQLFDALLSSILISRLSIKKESDLVLITLTGLRTQGSAS